MASNQNTQGERIAKVMARAGLCSRREAEGWITAGRVSVNGTKITSPALNIAPSDKIVVDGRALPSAERTRLFLYHKPSGLVTTSADPQGRPTIFDSLPKDLPRLISVGRLDLATEGLLLLTNDGGLARALELPSTAWLRRYRVRAYGKVTQPQLDELRDGVTVDGIRYGAIDAQLDREQPSNVWITFAIREGKNREVRNVLRHLGLQVSRLIRVSFGPFQLGDLSEGDVAEVPTRILRDQLGDKLVKASGANFAAPIVEREGRPEARTLGGHEPRKTTGSAPPSENRKAQPSRDDSRREDRKPAPRTADRPKKKAAPKSPFHRPSRGEGAKPSFDERGPKRGGRPQRGKRSH
jgi:23S rRNA pseudouridine2605 synthase